MSAQKSAEVGAAPNTPAARDKQSMGLPAAITLIMGSIIGTGVFILPSSLAVYGWLGLIGLVVATLGAAALALVFASLSKRRPMQGGPYAYAREAYGDVVGFTNAWSYWCAAWPGNSAIVVAWSGYVMALFGWNEDNNLLRIVICGVGLLVPAIINLFGVKSMAMFQTITTVLKVIPLIFMATVGLFFAFQIGAWPSFNPSGGSTFNALATAIALATFVYVGIETASIAASKVRNPEKNVPIATVGGTVGVAIAYVLVTIAIYGIVPNGELQSTTAPFSLALNEMFGGTWSGKVVAAFAVISGIGALNSWVMIAAEVPQAAARNKVFPQLFDRTNKYDVPYWGVITGQGLAFILVIIASIGQTGVSIYNAIVLMSNVAVGVPYFFSVLAQLYYLYTEGRKVNPQTFVREVIIAIVALAFTFYMIYGAGQTAVFIGFLVFMIGWVVMCGLYVQTGKYGSTSLEGLGENAPSDDPTDPFPVTAGAAATAVAEGTDTTTNTRSE